jgi:MerR family transcriptional regulator, light-induced transcriptional regulator
MNRIQRREASMGDPEVTRAAEDLRVQLDAALERFDRAEAVALVRHSVEQGRVDIMTLYRLVLAPLLDDVGAAWSRGRERVWQEHFATSVVVTIMESLYPTVRELAENAEPCGKTAVLAAPSQEHHVVGLRMVADHFELAGWRVVYLGADTPEAEIRAAARSVPADAVVMSASTHYQRLELRHIADKLREELPDIRVWVGGAAFALEHEGWPDEEILDLPAIDEAARRACFDTSTAAPGPRDTEPR